jgi:hypothetical protein
VAPLRHAAESPAERLIEAQREAERAGLGRAREDVVFLLIARLLEAEQLLELRDRKAHFELAARFPPAVVVAQVRLRTGRDHDAQRARRGPLGDAPRDRVLIHAQQRDVEVKRAQLTRLDAGLVEGQLGVKATVEGARLPVGSEARAERRAGQEARSRSFVVVLSLCRRSRADCRGSDTDDGERFRVHEELLVVGRW